ncbi:MAG: tyrosine recombinase XerC [Oscillospiraceae bacterium]|nr:tyrosine recombinase XerC [Oscillospiraceae bacterium]
MDYRSEVPEIIKSFLVYHETVKGHSKKTVDEYYLDLRTFFKYMKLEKDTVPAKTPFDEISISDVDISFIRSITLSDVYSYLAYLSREREKSPKSSHSAKGLTATSRARKISTIRSFYKYLTNKAKLLDVNPLQDLDSPKIMKTLPRYLSEDESVNLLTSVDGANRERDFAIITLFLNCGLRISELIGLDQSDIHGDSLRVLGKGGKERVVYLNDACQDALDDYLIVRRSIAAKDPEALFLSSQRTRISRSTVHALVKKHIKAAGLDSSKYSSHKLRHTAATLMLHNGVDVRTLQELLGHEHLNTTEIYTHVESSGLREAAKLSPLASFKRRDKDEEKDEKNEDE